jgi:hypothetical protein
MTVVARDLKNNDTTDAGFDLLTDPTTIGAVTGDCGITRILFGATGVDGGFATGDATNGIDVDVTRMAALVAGSAVIGGVTQSGTWNVTVNVALPTGSNVIGAVTQSGVWNVTNVSGTISLPTGASTLAEQQSQTTALQLLDDVVATGGAAASTKAYQVGGSDGTNAQIFATDTNGQQRIIGGAVHDATASTRPLGTGARASDAVPTAVSADGDACHFWVDRRGALKNVIVDDAGDSAMDGTNNALRVNVVAGGAGDGAILDGVTSSIKASVLDYTNSNPLAVRLTDTSGDYVGAGAGTQYTEDAAAAADPIGTQVVLVRKDTPATITSADGDVIAQRATNYGAAYVQLVTSAGAFIDSVGGGTEYTEDAAAAADPIGKALVLVRNDARSGSLTSADGDNVAARGTNAGELYVKHVDTIAVTQSGTWNVGTVTTVTTVSTVTNVSSVNAVIPGTGATNLGKAEDGAHTTGDTGVMGLAVRTDTPINRSGTDGDYEPLQMAAGRLWTSATIDAALPAGTNAIGKLAANSGVDIGDTDVTSVIPGTGATNLGKAEDAAHTSGDVGVMMLAVRTDTQAALAGTTGDYIPLMTDSLGGLYVTDRPLTAGGLLISRDLDADETETEAKATAGQVFGYYFANTHATSWRYLKFYNATAATVVVGTTTPVLTLGLPAASAGHIEFSKGIEFATAICYAVTTGVADNDTGAPGANEVVLNVLYK